MADRISTRRGLANTFFLTLNSGVFTVIGAGWDGDTPLKEHYWGTAVTVPLGRVVQGLHGPTGSPSTFERPTGSRIYAMGPLSGIRGAVEAEHGGE